MIVVVVIGGFALIGSNSGSRGQTSTASQSPATTNTVEIKGYAFNPSAISIKSGTTVTWTNSDAVAHTVTSDGSSKEVFDSGNLDKGKTFSYKFAAAGTFTYHCTPHTNMHGTITVTN